MQENAEVEPRPPQHDRPPPARPDSRGTDALGGGALAAGVTAVVQPGGSVRDAEVIEACDRRGIAMMFTGRRVFRH